MKAFLITLFAFSMLTARAQIITISGTVIAGRQPVAGATVVLQHTDHKTITDAGGKFLLTGVRAGVYTLEVSSVGYGTVIKMLTAAGNNLFVQVPLGADLQHLDTVIVQSAGQMHSGFTRL